MTKDFSVKILQTLSVLCFIDSQILAADLPREERQLETNTPPIVVKSLGVLLKPIGFLASGGDSTFVSVFLDVPTPKMERYDCRSSYNERCNASQDWVQQTLEDLSHTSETNVSLTVHPMTFATDLHAESLAECLSFCASQTSSVCAKLAFNEGRKRCRLNHGHPYQLRLTQLMIANYEKRGLEAEFICGNWTAIVIDKTLRDRLSNHCRFNFNEPGLAKVFRQQEQEEIAELWEKSNDTYTTLIKAFQLKTDEATQSNISSSNRNKRHAAVIAAAAALPIVGLGITYWESLRVRNYVKKLEARFDNFAAESIEFNRKQVRINENVVKIYQDLSEQQNKLSCDLDIIAYQILRRKQVNKWIHTTNTILSGVLSNKLTTGVLPEVMPFEYLGNLTSNSIFKNTIYASKPESIYTLGKLTLVGLKNLRYTWRYHFVLTVPTIRAESVYNRYFVDQVGIKANSSCLHFNLPDQVYQINDKFYEVMEDNCYERDNALKICLKPTTEKAIEEHVNVACLNKEQPCSMKPVICQDRTSFSTAGVLAFSDKAILGIEKGSGHSLIFEEIGNPNLTTNFYSWENYSHIMIGNRLIQSLQQPIMHIEFEPVEQLGWKEYLRRTEFRAIHTNLTQLIESVESQKQTLDRLDNLKHKESNLWNNSQLTSYIAYGSLGGWVVTITILLIWRLYHRLKTYKKKLNKTKTDFEDKRSFTNQNYITPTFVRKPNRKRRRLESMGSYNNLYPTAPELDEQPRPLAPPLAMQHFKPHSGLYPPLNSPMVTKRSMGSDYELMVPKHNHNANGVETLAQKPLGPIIDTVPVEYNPPSEDKPGTHKRSKSYSLDLEKLSDIAQKAPLP